MKRNARKHAKKIIIRRRKGNTCGSVDLCRQRAIKLPWGGGKLKLTRTERGTNHLFGFVSLAPCLPVSEISEEILYRKAIKLLSWARRISEKVVYHGRHTTLNMFTLTLVPTCKHLFCDIWKDLEQNKPYWDIRQYNTLHVQSTQRTRQNSELATCPLHQRMWWTGIYDTCTDTGYDTWDTS